jgi:predicted lactoylglutathione lyase
MATKIFVNLPVEDLAKSTAWSLVVCESLQRCLSGAAIGNHPRSNSNN